MQLDRLKLTWLCVVTETPAFNRTTEQPNTEGHGRCENGSTTESGVWLLVSAVQQFPCIYPTLCACLFGLSTFLCDGPSTPGSMSLFHTNFRVMFYSAQQWFSFRDGQLPHCLFFFLSSAHCITSLKVITAHDFIIWTVQTKYMKLRHRALDTVGYVGLRISTTHTCKDQNTNFSFWQN